MHIIHFVQRYLPAVGGAELHMATISERLVAAGHDVTVVTSDARSFELFWQPKAARLNGFTAVINGVKVIRFPIRHLPFAPTSYHALRRLLWLGSRLRMPLPNVARLTPWLPALWQWLPTAPPADLVAGMNVAYEPFLQAGLWLAKKRGVPFVIYPLAHLGAGEKPGQDVIGRFYTMRQQNRLVRKSDAIIAQTTASRDYYHAQGVPLEKMHVVGPGIAPDDLLDIEPAPPTDRSEGFIIFSLSALCFDKGTIHLAEAVRRLWENGRSDITLVLGGEPLLDMQAYLAEQPEKSRPWLRLLGRISEAQKRYWLTRCALFAMPSRTDSFGVVYLEAWLHQKPVVAAQAWGVNSIVRHEENGVLVPFGDVARLASALSDLLDRPEKAARLAKQGEATAREHTWDKKFAQIEQIYEDLGAV